MRGARARVPLVAAALGLAGALASTLLLFHAATGALERTLEARLRGAGEAAALLLSPTRTDDATLAALLHANALDGAFVLDRELTVLADAHGGSGRRAGLLRVDPALVERALAGEVTVASSWEVGELEVATAYFPLRGEAGAAHTVLALEAGKAFVQARRDVRRAAWTGVALAVLGAGALAVAAARFAGAEHQRRETAARAARGEALARMAAMAAHEIRNPLGVIRGTVELMRERRAGQLSARDEDALSDVLSEVERLRGLTEDLLVLSSDRPLATGRVDVRVLLTEAARALEVAFPSVRVRVPAEELPALEGDAGRLRQVLLNLMTNAAQAQGGAGEVELRAQVRPSTLALKVCDRGPGVPEEVRARLFEPFVSGRSDGNGLGLALSRRLVERHGGTLRLLPGEGAGAVFELTLPLPARARAEE
ncbi:MAG: HAMP domain-containing histidine kinase [Myxococcaceae bacterium]|nr:HAMP domain-containing histidine kinase [Myxococcaceae bacterium]